MTAEELLAKHGIKLESTAPGRHYITCPQCSAARSREHQGNKCLGVTIDAKGARWGCNHCGWTGPEKGNGDDRQQQQELQAYVYRGVDGVPLFRKVRNRPGRQPRFWLEHVNEGSGTGWSKGTKGVDTKIIYRADEVKKAIAEGRVVACVEGEKDGDGLWAIGVPATCNAHGASEPGKKPKWTRAHSDQLRGADIVVFNDNDPAGYEHADATCKLSLGIAKRVRRLDLKPHWTSGEMLKSADVSDWLALGHTREELEALIANAPDYVPPTDGKEAQGEPVEPSAADAEIERLAKLTPLQYEQERKAAAERLEVRASILDKLVQAERAQLGLDGGDGKQGRKIEFPEPEPWPEPVDGVALLNALAGAIRKHVVMSTAASHIAALWTMHSWLVDCFVISPRLCIRSATKGCGKTLTLDVIGRLVPRPLRTLSITPAATFRTVEGWQPTLLIDEADTFLNDNDGLRGILDGNRKGDTVTRTVGDQHEVRVFATYSAVTIALIGVLPDTLHDRSVVVELKRRLPRERIAPFRFDRAGHLDVLARMAARWAADNAERVASTDPEMPEGVINREADNWRPLAAIAKVAGGRWPARVSRAGGAAHAAAATGDEASMLEMVLADIRDAFATDKATTVTDVFGAERVEITSAVLVKVLVAIEGRPWAEMGRDRKPMTQNRLARMLRPLKIKPSDVGPEDARVKGYRLDQFTEAFDRYLEGGSHPRIRAASDEMGVSGHSNPRSHNNGCADATAQKPPSNGHLRGCADAKGEKPHLRARPRSDDLPVVATPDLGPDPLDEHGAPRKAEPPRANGSGPACAYCGRLGGNQVAFDGLDIRLHRECEDGWISKRMAEESIR